jgi:hypothetical protein
MLGWRLASPASRAAGETASATAAASAANAVVTSIPAPWDRPPVALPAGPLPTTPGLHRLYNGLLLAVATVPGSGVEARARAYAACRAALTEAGASDADWPVAAGEDSATGTSSAAALGGLTLRQALDVGNRRQRAARLLAEVRWGLVPDGQQRELSLGGERLRLVATRGPDAAARARSALGPQAELATWDDAAVVLRIEPLR